LRNNEEKFRKNGERKKKKKTERRKKKSKKHRKNEITKKIEIEERERGGRHLTLRDGDRCLKKL
jgi:hypothetical protein